MFEVHSIKLFSTSHSRRSVEQERTVLSEMIGCELVSIVAQLMRISE